MLAKLTRIHCWLAKNARTLSLAGGTSIVVLWTLIRHITNGVNFDVVGQIGLAEQWANGQMAGAQVGTTNYLLKIPFYILVNHLHFLSPMNRILLLAVLFNVSTFILLFVLFEKIMNLYRVKNRSWFYLAMAWLATIAGGEFWVEYANSRNLETVGGVLFLYLVLKYIKTGDRLLLALLGVVGSVVFFADSLQLYVCGIGVCLFMLVRLAFLRTKSNATLTLAVVGITAIGYLGSQILFHLAEKILGVTFLTAPTTRTEPTLSNIAAILRGLFASTAKIFDANFTQPPHNLNTVRELLNVLVLVFLVYLIIRLLIRAHKSTAFGLLLTVIAANYLVYAASGQVTQWATSRYLIMVPLLAVLILAISSDELGKKYKPQLQCIWLLIIMVSGVMLLGALAINWPDRHSKDEHIGTLVSFMHEQHFSYALASREVGVTTTYFSQGKVTALPMLCGPGHVLQPTYLFYDKAAFNGLRHFTGEVPVILQSDEVRTGANACDKDNIIAQLGNPKREVVIPGIGTAIIYNASSLRIAN